MIHHRIILHWKRNKIIYFLIIFVLLEGFNIWADTESAQKIVIDNRQEEKIILKSKPKAFVLLYYSEIRNDIISGEGVFLDSLITEYKINYNDNEIKKKMYEIALSSNTPLEFYQKLQNSYNNYVRLNR